MRFRLRNPYPAPEGTMASAPDPYDSMKGGVSDATEYASGGPMPPNEIPPGPTETADAPSSWHEDTSEHRARCVHCGALRPTEFELVNESIDALAPRGADLIGSFYANLFAEAPELREIFPGDMSAQREKLLGAIVALARNFDPADAGRMAKLDAALEQFGTSHARFGEYATPEAYATVGRILLLTLEDFAGKLWTAALAQAWRRRYRYASGRMIAAQALVDGDA